MSPLRPTEEAFCFLLVPKKQNMKLFQCPLYGRPKRHSVFSEFQRSRIWNYFNVPFTADLRDILFFLSSEEADYGTISMSPLRPTLEAFCFLSVPKKQNMELFQCPLYGRPQRHSVFSQFQRSRIWNYFNVPFTADLRGILFSLSSKEAEYGTISISPLRSTLET